MKNRVLATILAVTLISIFVLAGCGGETTTPATTSTTTATATATATATTTATATATATTTATATATATSTEPVPVYGGTMRIVAGAIPKVLGYAPEKAPSDSYYMLPVLEHLCEWGPDGGNLVPVLAESWEMDAAAKTITWHLQKGVSFTDGTPFNAEAVRWNFQLAIDNSTLTNGQFVESLEVKGDYTLVMHMTRVDWQMIQNYGLMQPISPTAFRTAGGTIPADSDIEKSIEWARANAVGTGPFTVSEWVRDDHITFVKNPNYWREGLPYLDAIEMRAIPDAMVAAATLEAGEADRWMETNSVVDIINLQGKGLSINWGPGMFNLLLVSSAVETNPLSNVKVREAIECALDRPTMAQTLGQGLYEPLHQMASSTWPGYVEGYDPRPYNTEKAKGLLTEAGYPNGLTLKVMATSTAGDAMALLQYYLGEAGIVIDPDIADLGRYFGSVFGTGWDDIVLTASGINPDATDLFVHFGSNPMTFRTTNIWKSDAFKALSDAALDPSYMGAADAMPKIREAIRQAGEDCLFIPLWRSVNACIFQPYVHTEYIKIHGIIWTPAEDWMEAH
ncbi:MAG: ABC transporter substrate-binding protein [Dehalococcoidales bacterium]|nr:ABC transporter substrate-binding protein [Dehalococcoidales bacterium]